MSTTVIHQDDFSEITQLITSARQRAVQAVNTTLIEPIGKLAKPSATK